MTMITQLIRNIQIIAAVIIIILLVFCGIGLYLFKFKKRTVKEQALDYSSFNRKEVVARSNVRDFLLPMPSRRKSCRQSADISLFLM